MNGSLNLKDKKTLNNQKWTTKINIVIQKSVNDRIIRRILLFNTNRSAFVPCLKRFRFHHGPFENTSKIVSSKLNIHLGLNKCLTRPFDPIGFPSRKDSNWQRVSELVGYKIKFGTVPSPELQVLKSQNLISPSDSA